MCVSNTGNCIDAAGARVIAKNLSLVPNLRALNLGCKQKVLSMSVSCGRVEQAIVLVPMVLEQLQAACRQCHALNI